MVARVIKLNQGYVTPGAVATAQDLIVQAKTQGPCDFVYARVIWQGTPATADSSGLLNGIDRIEVTIDSAGDPGQGDTGSTFYTLFGSGNVAWGAGPAFTHGMLETVDRMLFKVDCLETGIILGVTTVNQLSTVIRLPLGKNVPVQFTVHLYVAALNGWNGAGYVYTGGYLRMELFAHLVDSVADLKVRQTTRLNFGPLAEGEIFDIPNAPGYWFFAYTAECLPTGGVTYADRLGGGIGTSAVDTCTGWIKIQNSDGQVYDLAYGDMIKADMQMGNQPLVTWDTVDLWSNRLNGIGQYSRLMASPIDAMNLKMSIFPNGNGLATDAWRIWWFYSKKGQAVRQVNQQQSQTVDFGASGATDAQSVKK